MDQFTPLPDLSLVLPRDMFHQVIHNLAGSLPPPITDSPEDRVRRDNAAIALVASLLPANADEANIAATYASAIAQAQDAARLAQEKRSDTKTYLQCTAQSANMMRQARGARSLLMRVQAARAKREADPAALDRANWTEHCAMGLMAIAFGRQEPVSDDEPAEPPPEPALPLPAPPAPDLAAEAEQFALIHPDLTALIRTVGGLPEPVRAALDPAVVPPSPALLQALLTGNSPTLRALGPPAEPRPAAE